MTLTRHSSNPIRIFFAGCFYWSALGLYLLVMGAAFLSWLWGLVLAFRDYGLVIGILIIPAGAIALYLINTVMLIVKLILVKIGDAIRG